MLILFFIIVSFLLGMVGVWGCFLLGCSMDTIFKDQNSRLYNIRWVILSLAVVLVFVLDTVFIFSMDRILNMKEVLVKEVPIPYSYLSNSDNTDISIASININIGNGYSERVDLDYFDTADLSESVYTEPTLVITAKAYHFMGYDDVTRDYRYVLYK